MFIELPKFFTTLYLIAFNTYDYNNDVIELQTRQTSWLF